MYFSNKMEHLHVEQLLFFSVILQFSRVAYPPPPGPKTSGTHALRLLKNVVFTTISTQLLFRMFRI